MPKIDSVRIKDVDSSLSTKGGRTLEVRCGSHTFTTPTRPLSTMDISAKSYLGYRSELKSDIAVLAIDFSGKRKEYFLKRNGVLAKAEKRPQSLWNSMSHPPECGCSVCKGQTREELIERFAYLDNGDISKSGLRYYSVLHDHQSDMQELEVFRRYISSDGAKEYDQRIEECLSELKSVI